MMAAEAAHDRRASQPALTAANSGFTRECGVPVVGKLTCFALRRDGIQPMAASASPGAIPAGYGYGPAQLQSAYNLTAASAADGAGRTVAVVDGYDDPDAASDLAAYRSAAGLPPVPSFKKVNEEGQASPLPPAGPTGQHWAGETALDLDMVSAICPLCNIVLVEVDDSVSNGFFMAQNAAASLAGYVSDSIGVSWGPAGNPAELTDDTEYFDHPGVVFTAASGDSGYADSGFPWYPASSPNVVSVGGTTLRAASNPRGWTESVWENNGSQGTDSGCVTAYEPQPTWQAELGLPAGCSGRIDNGVSADADPGTGVAAYDTADGTGGWFEVGGTSASAPMVAAMYALAGNPGTAPAADIYAHAGDFYDVTSGSNGSCSPAYLCTAETGYDGPTGIGTPDGIAGLVAAGTPTGEIVAGDDSADCVDAAGGSSAPGTKVEMWACYGNAASQEWTMGSNGTVGIDGQCLDISGGGTADGTLVEEWTCTGGANQQWTAVNGELVNPATGMCLDDPNWETAEGTQLDLWTCNGGSNQQWKVP
jgi:Ricin-type beta-trefoil lectin domain/Subtilase family